MAINKVQYGNTTLIDLTDTTAVASDVAQGKYFYGKDGVKTLGTASGGGAGAVIQDEDGGLHFPEDEINAFSDAVTELENGGFLHTITGVMASGDGNEWSWMGRNPTLVHDFGTTRVYFKDSGYSTWTPSTSSTVIESSHNLEGISLPQVYENDHITLYKFRSHFEYGSEATGVAQPEDFYYVATFISTPQMSRIDSDVISGTTNSSGTSKYGLLYKNTSGTTAYTPVQYGVYSVGLTAQISGGNILVTVPNVLARCSTNYFSVENAGAVNQEASYYEYRVQVWDVDLWTGSHGAMLQCLRDMYLNGL